MSFHKQTPDSQRIVTLMEPIAPGRPRQQTKAIGSRRDLYSILLEDTRFFPIPCSYELGLVPKSVFYSSHDHPRTKQEIIQMLCHVPRVGGYVPPHP